ncbi:gliding motility-associated C-terminal domain-containing protein [Altibacter sp.]|uniref:gliding motility-associated C-terminal domain-containing protein n=1 Tax=Altibacter sp. TaxID=2024823 RepID=UPI002585FB54|nr:gliding motility-associated C-terminal domain-containing protein [Altibacter sp.]MCW9037196.1 gliding motility-associated C-terminal domain-containing protein [Altibacter sp.]
MLTHNTMSAKAYLALFLFFTTALTFGQTTVDCTASPLNNTFCYANNDNSSFVFQSSNGFPLRIVFNSGTVENNFDEVVILDSNGITDLNEETPYGNNGDLTGLTYTSSGDTITLMITSDVSNSCQSGGQTAWDYDVFCTTCLNPEVNFAAEGNCDGDGEFFISVDVTDLGSASALEITDDQGSTPVSAPGTGTYQIGPYVPFTNVTVTVTNLDDTSCAVSSDPLTFVCISDGGCELLNAGPDVVLSCETPCTELEAEIIAVPRLTTSSYLVQGPICDLPPVSGGTPTNLVIDDRWSDVITIPFTFNYFQNDYTQLVMAANGQISFDTSLANQFNGWNSAPEDLLPYTDSNFPLNTIYGAFHDLNPAVNPDPARINYFVTGEAPFRIFVLNFDNVPHFGSSCDSTFFTTQQILLYESLNVIDVNLINKPSCPGWNEGLATLGIMGNDLTEFSVPPDRNTGVWEATNENWRFVPNGQPTGASSFQWLDPTGAVIGTSPRITVCPTEDTVYTAVLTTELEDGSTEVRMDDVLVELELSFAIEVTPDVQACDQESADLSVTVSGSGAPNATILWSTGETTPTITVSQSGDYTVTVTVENCSLEKTINVQLEDSPVIDLGADIETCFEEPVILDASPTNFDPATATYEWSKDGVVLASETDATLVVTELGEYSVVVTVGFCSSTDSILIEPRSDLEVTVGDDFKTCANDIRTITANTDETDVSYQWLLNDELIPGETGSSIEISFEPNTVGTQTYTVIITKGDCTGTDSVDVTLYNIGQCVISEGLSPNGDGMNDCLDLEYLVDRTGAFSVEIFNRLGTSVYTQSNYLNEWCGQDNNNAQLPTGTYFYVIKFDQPDQEFGAVKSGWIYLNTQSN